DVGQSKSDPWTADLPNAIVPLIGDEQVAKKIDCDAKRIPQGCCRSRAVVTRVAVPGGAGKCSDNSIRIHFPDAIVQAICDVEVSEQIKRDTRWIPQLGVSRRPAVAGVAGGARASDRRDDTVGIDPADAIVVVVADEKIADGINRDAPGRAESGFGRRPAIARESVRTSAHY